ncbi:MAG: PAS domain-containing protein [Sulfitobacter sp.]
MTLNASGCAMTGRLRADFCNRTALEIYPGACGRSAYERHCKVVASGAPLTYEIDLPLGGINRKIRTTLTPEFDDNGKVHLLYGSSTDVTAERAAQHHRQRDQAQSTRPSEHGHHGNVCGHRQIGFHLNR